MVKQSHGPGVAVQGPPPSTAVCCWADGSGVAAGPNPVALKGYSTLGTSQTRRTKSARTPN